MASVTNLLSYRLQQLFGGGASPSEMAEAARQLMEAERACRNPDNSKDVIALHTGKRHLSRVM